MIKPKNIKMDNFIFDTSTVLEKYKNNDIDEHDAIYEILDSLTQLGVDVSDYLTNKKRPEIIKEKALEWI